MHMEAHSLSCEHREVPCPIDGCGQLVKASELQDHASGCAHRITPCSNVGCSAQVKAAALEQHQEVCEYREVLCPNYGCFQKITACEVEEHARRCKHRMRPLVGTGKSPVIADGAIGVSSGEDWKTDCRMDADGWCPKEHNEEQWLEFDFGQSTWVQRVFLKGNSPGGGEYWVSKFTLSYSNSMDGLMWHDHGLEFEANTDVFGLSENILDPPIVACRIKLHPTAWNYAIACRVEFLGTPATLGMHIPQQASETTAVYLPYCACGELLASSVYFCPSCNLQITQEAPEPEAGPELREGQWVELHGLSDETLNGQAAQLDKAAHAQTESYSGCGIRYSGSGGCSGTR